MHQAAYQHVVTLEEKLEQIYAHAAREAKWAESRVMRNRGITAHTMTRRRIGRIVTARLEGVDHNCARDHGVARAVDAVVTHPAFGGP